MRKLTKRELEELLAELKLGKPLTKQELEKLASSGKEIDIYFYERDGEYVHTRKARGRLAKSSDEPLQVLMGYFFVFKEDSQQSQIHGIFPDGDNSTRPFKNAYLTKEGRDLYIIREEIENITKKHSRIRRSINPKYVPKFKSTLYFPPDRL
jgi:hypothetical protein